MWVRKESLKDDTLAQNRGLRGDVQAKGLALKKGWAIQEKRKNGFF